MRLFSYLFFLLTVQLSQAQDKVKIYLDGQVAKAQEVKDLPTSQVVQEMILDLWNQGYVFAGIDSVYNGDYFLHRGKKVEIQNQKGLSNLMIDARKDLAKYVNGGYPFAAIHFDSVSYHSSELSVNYIVEKGPYVAFDSLIFTNPLKTKAAYISSVLGIQKGSPYSEKSINEMPTRIKRIGHVDLNGKPDVSFQDGKAWTYLNLAEIQTGRFQGILGILPNQGNQSRPLVTGNVDLELNNLFNQGKKLDLSWARFGELSQKLDLEYEHSLIGGSNLNGTARLNFWKQDSSFVNAKFRSSLEWWISEQLKLGVTYEHELANVLLRDANRIEQLELLDFEQNWYGLELTNGESNEASFRNFTAFKTNLSIGNRMIERNPNLPIEFYDSLAGSITNWRISTISAVQKKLGKSAAFFHKLVFNHLTGEQIPANQKFRLGGLQSLRGFNEQFFYASTAIVSQTEVRFFFEEESFVFGFWDQGFLKNEYWVQPAGLGLGLSLSTSNGLFSFAFGMGGLTPVDFELVNAKVHFGYTSTF